ncbi:hypothetical protein FB451DRAFT_1039327 [Mycena latifolia]|nr:hypothetical protein FB451DRAFT_1039327 [Mycena latifolia]
MSSTYNVGGRVVRRGPVSVKEGGGLASWIWSTKWLVLKEMVLTLHKSESSLTPQSVIPLSEITHLERTDLRTHCLLLETQDRKRFFLSLQNDDELYGWQDDISFLSPFSGVSQPTNFVHRVHVGYDPVSKKYTASTADGLPDQWKKLLENESVITRDYSKYPQAVLDVLKFYTDHQERNLEREIDSGAGNDYSTDPQALLDVIDVYKARKTEELHREIDSSALFLCSSSRR